MKRIDELGIAETPWIAERAQTIPVYYVKNASHSGCFIASTACSGTMREDARLMAAAPKLYDALYRIVIAADDSVLDVEAWRKRLNEALDDARVALDYAAGESEVTK